MALSEDDLYRIEIKVRTSADRLRKEASVFDDSPTVEAQLHARTKRDEAEAIDLAADLLVGLQGDWPRLGPMVREGFKKLRGEHERRKAAGNHVNAEDQAA